MVEGPPSHEGHLRINEQEEEEDDQDDDNEEEEKEEDQEPSTIAHLLREGLGLSQHHRVLIIIEKLVLPSQLVEV